MTSSIPPRKAFPVRVVLIVAALIIAIVGTTFGYVHRVNSKTLPKTSADLVTSTVVYPHSSSGSASAAVPSKSTISPAPATALALQANPVSIVNHGKLDMCSIDDGTLAAIHSAYPNESTTANQSNVRNSCTIYREPEKAYIDVVSLIDEPELTNDAHADLALPSGWLIVETERSAVFLKPLTDGWVGAQTDKPANRFHSFVHDFDALLADAQLT